MTVQQEILFGFLSEKAKQTVEQMFSNIFLPQKFQDLQGISLRFVKVNLGIIRGDFLYQTPIGKFFKPIGTYDKSLNCTVVNEFFQEMGTLENDLETLSFKMIKPFSLKENAIVAAFSIETAMEGFSLYNEIKRDSGIQIINHDRPLPSRFHVDKNFIANAMKCNFMFSFEGTPFFFLDDTFDNTDAFAEYHFVQGGGMNFLPCRDTFEDYSRMEELGMLAIFNGYK